MKAQSTLIATALIATTFFSSCRKDDHGFCIKANGEEVKETRNVEYFNEVELKIDGDIYLYQDSMIKTPEVIVEASDNLLSRIKTEVKDQTLKIDTKKCTRGNSKIKVYITVADLEGVNINGSGNIYSQTPFYTDDIEFDINGSGNIDFEAYANEITLDINGSGNIELNGTANDAEYKVNGSGNIKCFAMDAKDCYARITGSGNIEAYVSNTLDVSISGSGDVIYDGPGAIVNVNSTGSGNIKRK